jgi:hypothetical protein
MFQWLDILIILSTLFFIFFLQTLGKKYIKTGRDFVLLRPSKFSIYKRPSVMNNSNSRQSVTGTRRKWNFHLGTRSCVNCENEKKHTVTKRIQAEETTLGIQQSLSCREISRLLYNVKFHGATHKSYLFLHSLSQYNSIRILIFYIFIVQNRS